MYWLKRTWFQLQLWQAPFVPALPAQRGVLRHFTPEERATRSIIASPAVAEGVYYLGDVDDRFYARDAASDAEVWRFEAGDGIVSSLIIVSDRIYFGARNGLLCALQRNDGASLWTLDLDAPIELPPTYANDRLYIRTVDGRLHAVE